jgi:uncharacterized membrane protein YczE
MRIHPAFNSQYLMTIYRKGMLQIWQQAISKERYVMLFLKYKKLFFRTLFYLAGLLILALGITLNTKTGLGVSPIISVPFTVSTIWQLDFGNMTFVMYGILILIQIAIKKKNTKLNDLLQIVLSVIFTRFLNLFNDIIKLHNSSFLMNLFLLLGAVVLTGVGAAMSVNARIIANPGDGIVQTIADAWKKDMGLVKNILDFTCITTALTIGLVSRGKLVGVGIGTMIAVLGVGRVIWLYNKLLKKKVEILSGMEGKASSAVKKDIIIIINNLQA